MAAAMDEQRYLQGMIDHGALMCMDAYGHHPYGYAYAPEHDPAHVPNGFAFRGVEQMREILVTAGGAHLPSGRRSSIGCAIPRGWPAVRR